MSDNNKSNRKNGVNKKEGLTFDNIKITDELVDSILHDVEKNNEHYKVANSDDNLTNTTSTASISKIKLSDIPIKSSSTPKNEATSNNSSDSLSSSTTEVATSVAIEDTADIELSSDTDTTEVYSEFKVVSDDKKDKENPEIPLFNDKEYSEKSTGNVDNIIAELNVDSDTDNNIDGDIFDLDKISGGKGNTDDIYSDVQTTKSHKSIRFKNKRNRNIVIVCVAILLVLAGIVCAYSISDYTNYVHMMESTVNINTFYDGIHVNGVDVSKLTKEQAIAKVEETESSLRPDINITITCAGKDYTLNQDNLSFSYNTEQVVNEAYMSGRYGDTQDRYDYVESIKNTPDNFPVACTLDPSNCSLDDYISELATEVHVDPEGPNVSNFDPNASNMFTYSSGSTGIDLDTESLKSTLVSTLANHSYDANVAADTNIIPIPDTSNEPSLDEQTVLVSSFTTTSTNNANANSNMAVALEAINGSVVKPGEVFSFNKTTGNSTDPNNGYLPAGVIVDGELEDQYGGGICQASTTLYGAVMRADMDIVTRSPHAWPSSYVPIGQDAMVSYGSSDFKFKNTSDYPVFIKAGMSGATLSVQIYGYHPTSWDTIDVVTEGNSDSTYATGNKIFYKNGSVVKEEAIAPSSYDKKVN